MKPTGAVIAAASGLALSLAASAGDASDAGAPDAGAAHDEGFAGTWKLVRKQHLEATLTFGGGYAVTLVVDAKGGATWTETAGGTAPLWGQRGWGQPSSPTCTDTVRGLRAAVKDDGARLEVTSGPATREACSPGPRCTAKYLTFSGMAMVGRRMTCTAETAKGGMRLVFERRGVNTMATSADDGTDAVLIYQRGEGD